MNKLKLQLIVKLLGSSVSYYEGYHVKILQMWSEVSCSKRKKIYLRNSVSWLTIIQSKMFMSVINIKLKRRNKTLENLKKKGMSYHMVFVS